MRINRLASALVAAFALLVAVPAALAAEPQAYKLGDLEISGGFARATLPNAPVGGGFLTITNHGATDDRLVSAASPLAGEVQLHDMSMDGSVMKMTELPDGVPLPAGKTVSFSPDGLHIMFMHLASRFIQGKTVPVTLTFARAGRIDIELPIGGIAAKAAPGAAGSLMMAPGNKMKMSGSMMMMMKPAN